LRCFGEKKLVIVSARVFCKVTYERFGRFGLKLWMMLNLFWVSVVERFVCIFMGSLIWF